MIKKRMKKTIAVALSSLMLLSSLPFAAGAKELTSGGGQTAPTPSNGEFYYDVTRGTTSFGIHVPDTTKKECYITSYEDGDNPYLIDIPDQITIGDDWYPGTYDVIGLENGGQQEKFIVGDASQITDIYIYTEDYNESGVSKPGLQSIESGVFADCTGLQNVVFTGAQQSAPTVGEGAFPSSNYDLWFAKGSDDEWSGLGGIKHKMEPTTGANKLDTLLKENKNTDIVITSEDLKMYEKGIVDVPAGCKKTIHFDKYFEENNVEHLYELKMEDIAIRVNDGADLDIYGGIFTKTTTHEQPENLNSDNDKSNSITINSTVDNAMPKDEVGPIEECENANGTSNDGIKDDRIQYGTGIYNSKGGTLNLRGTTFKDNGMWFSSVYNMGTLDAKNCNFNNNNSTWTETDPEVGKRWGGSAICNAGHATLTSNVFDGNKSECVGGAINNIADMTIDNCTFINNNAKYYGGAIYSSSSEDTTKISGKLKINNTLIGEYIYSDDYGRLSLKIGPNTATEGGGVYLNYHPGSVEFSGIVRVNENKDTTGESAVDSNLYINTWYRRTEDGHQRGEMIPVDLKNLSKQGTIEEIYTLGSLIKFSCDPGKYNVYATNYTTLATGIPSGVTCGDNLELDDSLSDEYYVTIYDNPGGLRLFKNFNK